MICSKNYSQDSKLGAGVWATYRGKQTCPLDCEMYSKCYAKKSFCGIQFANATNNYTETEGDIVKAYIQGLPMGDKIRHHVSGDMLINDKPDTAYINGLVEGHKSRPDLKGWTYTHAWERIKNPSVKSLTVNASCDTIADIKAARKAGWDTCTVVPKETPAVSTIEGEKIVICPNQMQKKKGIKLQCASCMMCAKQGRKFTIGFLKH